MSWGRFSGVVAGVSLFGVGGFCAEKEDRPLEIPLVKGEDSLGVVIPEHRLDGTLKSRFSLAVARLVEGSVVEVERSVFESLGKDGGSEVKVTLDLAQLDLATRRIRSAAKVLVVTPQYEVTSVGMDFDWAKKEGELKGPVTMIFSKQSRLGTGTGAPGGAASRSGDVGKDERK
jgi:hypothetical protein